MKIYKWVPIISNDQVSIFKITLLYILYYPGKYIIVIISWLFKYSCSNWLYTINNFVLIFKSDLKILFYYILCKFIIFIYCA